MGENDEQEAAPKPPEPAAGGGAPPPVDGNWGQIQALVTVAGGLVGAAAYIYLLGGLVVWLKLKAAQLPTDDAMRVLDRNRLLAVGIKAVLFEGVLLAALLGLLLLTWNWVKGSRKGTPDKPLEANPKWRTWKIMLHGVIVAILAGALLGQAADHTTLGEPSVPITILVAVLAAALWLLTLLPWLLGKFQRHDWKRWWVKTGLTVVACVMAILFLAAPAGVLVLVLMLFLHLSHLLQKLVDVNNPVTLMPAVVGMAVAMSLVVAVYIATPPVSLDRAAVYLENGRVVRGGYVGQSSEGVFLADCNADPVDPRVSTHVKLRIISADQVRRTRLGGPSFVVDYGEDPSLFDFGRYFFSRNPVDEWTRTMTLDVRDPELTCGRRHSLQMLGDRPNEPPARTLQVKVLGKGDLVLAGDDFVTERKEPASASRETLSLIPSDAARARYRCGGTIDETVGVEFTLDHGGSETREVEVVRRMKSTHATECRNHFLFQAEAINAR